MTKRIKQLEPGILLVDRYHIVKPLARSYCGNVYLARDFQLSYQIRTVKEIVIDCINESDRKNSIEWFNQESENIANLDHPSVPRIYDFFVRENRFYIVMNYVDGIELPALVKESGGSIGERTVVEWSVQLCDLFDYLHSRKPAIFFSDILMNDILVDRKRDRLVVTGLTSFLKRGKDRLKQEEYSDMFAIGSLMFRLLTGTAPNVKIGNNRPQKLNPNLSDGINHLVRKSIELHVAYRFASFAQMRQALEEHTRSLEEQYRKISGPLLSPPPPSILPSPGIFCQTCGNNVGADSLFCNFCGNPIVRRAESGARATEPFQQQISSQFIEIQNATVEQLPTEGLMENRCKVCSGQLRPLAKFCNKCGAVQSESESPVFEEPTSVPSPIIAENEPEPLPQENFPVEVSPSIELPPIELPQADLSQADLSQADPSPVLEDSPSYEEPPPVLSMPIDEAQHDQSPAENMSEQPPIRQPRYPTMENAPVVSSSKSSYAQEGSIAEDPIQHFMPGAQTAAVSSMPNASMKQPSTARNRRKKNWVSKLAKLFKRSEPDPSKFETVVRKPSNLFELNKTEIIRRRTNISFPSKVTVGKTYSLKVQIVPSEFVLPTGEGKETADANEYDALMELVYQNPQVSDQPPQLIRVKVSAAAENFDIENETSTEIIVPLSGKSPAAIFNLKGIEAGPGRIMIDFTQDGRPVGSVDLFPSITPENEKESEAQVNSDGEIGFHIRPDTPPDLIIKVFESRCGNNPGCLRFVVSSTNPNLKDLPVMDDDLGTQDLKSEVVDWVDEQLQSLGRLSRRSEVGVEEVNRTLQRIGFKLFDRLIPKRLQDLYWKLRSRGVRTVLILSDEPHIPWELIKPYRMNSATRAVEAEDDYWGEAFAMTHWLRGRPPASKFSLRRAVAVAASGGISTLQKPASPIKGSASIDDLPDDVQSLEKAITYSSHTVEKITKVDEEIYMLSSLNIGDVELNVLPPQRKALLAAFEKGGFGLLHLAAHGAFGGANSADASSVQLEDGPLSASELSAVMTEAIMNSSPLIFFNTCKSGRMSFSLTKLGSWGARLVQLGCGGFVGSLWPVSDEAALSFAKEFYIAILDGMPIGEAMIRARLLVRLLYPNDPAWLAYCCFADPTAKIVF